MIDYCRSRNADVAHMHSGGNLRQDPVTMDMDAVQYNNRYKPLLSFVIFLSECTGLDQNLPIDGLT